MYSHYSALSLGISDFELPVHSLRFAKLVLAFGLPFFFAFVRSLYMMCSFPTWCLGQAVDIDCVCSHIFDTEMPIALVL